MKVFEQGVMTRYGLVQPDSADATRLALGPDASSGLTRTYDDPDSTLTWPQLHVTRGTLDPADTIAGLLNNDAVSAVALASVGAADTARRPNGQASGFTPSLVSAWQTAAGVAINPTDAARLLAGSYSVQASSGSANYTISAPPVPVTINPRVIVVGANDTVYGTRPTAIVSGVLAGDTVNASITQIATPGLYGPQAFQIDNIWSANGALINTQTSPPPGVGLNLYGVTGATLSGVSAKNYVFASSGNPQTFAITPKTVTVTFDNTLVSSIAVDRQPALAGKLTYSIHGLVDPADAAGLKLQMATSVTNTATMGAAVEVRLDGVMFTSNVAGGQQKSPVATGPARLRLVSSLAPTKPDIAIISQGQF